MEFDNDKATVVVEKKSGARKWLIGGCGCLFLIVAVCGGFGYYGYAKFVAPAMKLTFENIELAQESPKVKELIGDPVTLGEPTTELNGQTMIMKISVSGANGSGTVVFQSTRSQDFTWSRDDMYLEMNGEKFSLDPDEATTLDIEGIE